MRKLLTMAVLLAAFSGERAYAQINCPNGFSRSGACGVALIGEGANTFKLTGSQNGSNPTVEGSRVLLVPSGAVHAAISLTYQTQVNIRAFTTTFTFVPNGWNTVIMFNNSNNNPYFNGSGFSAGAGCEADFFQAFSQPNPPNNVFALEFDSYEPLNPGSAFVHSSTQIYTSSPYVQSPCSPPINGEQIYPKISTDPVSLNSPAGSPFTTTGHTYSAELIYDGSNLTLNLCDLNTAAPCFSHTWTNVDISGSVGGGDTAWLGFGGATNNASTAPLYISSVVYNEGAVQTPKPPTPTPTATATATATATPTVAPTPSTTCSFTDPSGKVTTWVCQ